MKTGPKPIPVAIRFAEQHMPEPNSGCWLWIGACRQKGYGVIGDGSGRTRLAHRVSWELHRGPIPDDLCVLHRCDVSACVNPDHLFLGTIADNNADMLRKGRASGNPTGCGKGEMSHRAKLTEAQVLEIRNATGFYRDIAARYGIGEPNVSLIKNRKTWSHI